MSKRNRILSIVGLSLVGLLLIVIVSAILIVRSSWFHSYVREKVIAVTEESTGGKVEIGSFDFDWTHLRATIRNFVLHGTEPAGQAPLFRASLIQLDLKLLSGLEHMVDLQKLDVDQPQANLLIYPDGRTNVPEPKVKSNSNTSGLETIVDLAVGHFNLSNGSVAFNAEKAAFSARGENLRAQLAYNAANPAYQGQVSMAPLYLQSGKNQPLDLKVNLPVTIEKDRVTLSGARITTPVSQISIDGSLEHMNAPKTSAHLKASIGLDDIRKLVNVPIESGKGLPDCLTADLAATMDDRNIQISTARVNFGQSDIEASGNLKDPSGKGEVKFNTSLALGQIGRMLKVSAQPEGVLQASGTARLTGQSDYQVQAAIHGNNLAFRNGAQRFSNISVAGNLKADPKYVALDNFRLAAFGGDVTGSAALQDMAAFHFDGQLHGFNTRVLAAAFTTQKLPYEGIVSGAVKASGDIKAPGTKSIVADAHLAITPGSHGVPVSGRINAAYNGATNAIDVPDSYVALPNTRLDVSGSLDRRLDLKLVSHNLNDLEPAVGKPLPVQLHNGEVSFTGAVTGSISEPHIAGHLQATNFTVEDRPFDRLSADVNAAPSGAQIQNGSLTHAATQLQFAASAGLKKWTPENYEPLNASARISNADLADLLAIAGRKDVKASGTVNAVAQINGTIGDPRGNANLTVVNGSAYDEHFDRLAANVDFSDQLVHISNTQLAAGSSHIDLNATFQHPKNTFDTGTIHATLASNQMSLDQFNAVKQQANGVTGTVQVNADVSANLNQVNKQTEFELTNVNANLSARGLRHGGQSLGDLTATAQTSGSTVDYKVDSDIAGSTIRVNGNTQLRKDYPTTLAASIANLPIERILAVADRKDIPAKGNLNATANISGTLDAPQASAQIDLTKAVLYNEPLDRVQARFSYNNQLASLTDLTIAAGPARLQANGSFEHPKSDFEQGKLQFHVASNRIQLGALHIVQEQKPGLAGTLQLTADGAGTLQKLPKGSTAPPLLFSSLNADLNATGLQINKKPLGDLALKADTRGSDLVYTLDSDVGHSKIHGEGQTRLTGDYRTTAKLAFNNVTYAGLQPLLSSGGVDSAPLFNVIADGQVNVSGPATKPEDMTGDLAVSKLELTSRSRTEPGSNGQQQVRLQNQGPLTVTLAKQVLNVKSAHITGHSTDINLTGSVALNAKTPLDLQLSANTNLKLLEDFDKRIYSDGTVTLQTAVRGTFTQPLINGELKLDNASVNMIDIPNGLDRASGVIRFNGTSAVIQNLTAHSGGGTVTAGGAVGFANGVLRYGLRANAVNVRIRTPEGATVVVGANANLNGNSNHSVLAGTVTVNKIGFNPQSDFGSLLSKSTPPTPAEGAPSGLLDSMKLDVRIRTAPDVAVQTALAQNIQASADLTLRGTVATPGMLGRVTVSSGNIIFFGTTYNINDGSVSFYNPVSIDPILDVDLETKVQGVDVILTVAGPVNDMKLSYRSDPPLQFQEIVELLAAGKTPTSDPTILANQPAPPQQSLAQMGESAIVGQAVATPLANRLQRVFGVNQLKIDPTFTSGSSLPQARLTLQQQIATNITFTYITDVTQANDQILRVEWSINPQWSAVATRDQYGFFGIDFFYKKRFR